MLVWRARWAILALIIAAACSAASRVINSDTTGTPLDDPRLGDRRSCWSSASLSVVWGLLTFRAEEFVITSRRIIHAEGVINKRATDSSLEKINDAVLAESMFGRIFGFGDLDVLTASESGIERLRMLRDAKEFKKAMLEAKHELELELARPDDGRRCGPPTVRRARPRARPAAGRRARARRARPHRPSDDAARPPRSPAPDEVSARSPGSATCATRA